MFKRSKQFLTATVVVAILFTVMIMVSAWTPVEPPPYDLEYARSANGVLPFLVEGDKGNFGDPRPGFYNFKEDTPESAFPGADDENPAQLDFYPDPEDASKKISVWLSRDADDNLYIKAWESFNLEVHFVITKGGPDFFVYQYDGMMDEDEDLMNPKVGAMFENMSVLSNFSFYWTPETEETTTEETTIEAEETTTEAEETTTEAEETTTEAEETTTEAEETTTEAEEATEVLTIEEETLPLAEATTEAKTEAATEAATQATTQETLQLSDEEIPQTGQTGSSVVIGSTLLALAGSLFYILRRKRGFN